MKLTILADETSILPFLDAVQATDALSVQGCWSPSAELQNTIRQRYPDIRIVPQWDELLVDTSPDAVLVAGSSADIRSAARLLIQSGIPLYVVTDLSAGPSQLFSWTEAWQERGKVTPLFCSGVASVLKDAQAEFREARKGKLWKIEFERHLSPLPGSPNDRPSIQLDEADRALLQDLSWLEAIAGTPSQVTALVSGPDPSEASELSVLLAAKTIPEVRWTCTRDSGLARWTLKLFGSQGEIEIHCTENHHPTILGSETEIVLPIEQTLVADAAAQLDRIATGSTLSEWDRAIRLGETGAAVRRSLTKRRTVDLHFEEVSELSQFKSQMTAFGCGALLWALFGTISMLTLAGLLDPRDREYRTAASAGFVVKDSEFAEGSADLSPKGAEHVDRISRDWSATTPVLVVQSSSDPAVQLDEERYETVVNRLSENGLRDPANRTVLRPLIGSWFERVLLVGWCLVFLPLGIVLALQALIVAAR